MAKRGGRVRFPYDDRTPIQDPRLEQALVAYVESLPEGDSGHRYARMFCHTAKDASKDSLDDFLEECRLYYKDSTIKYIYSTLQRMYKIGGLKWPYRSSEAPTVRERSVFAPMLDPEVVEEMIQASGTVLTARMAFYLAISTTYGCRRIEMAQLEKKDINLKEQLIYIETRKSGRERYHLIPDQIMPVIKRGHKIIKPMTTKAMDRMWQRIEVAIQFPHVSGVGWHSIRRTLDKLLLEANLPVSTVIDFLRWKRSDRDMAYRYSRGTVIGRDTIQDDIAMQDRSIDEAVFKVHPFIKLWDFS